VIMKRNSSRDSDEFLRHDYLDCKRAVSGMSFVSVCVDGRALC
jgi:hypothetical protein